MSAPIFTHPCPITGCQRQLPATLLMCNPHWRRVPAPLQLAVYAAWRRGHPTEDYLDIRAQAIAAVEDKLRQHDSARP